MKSYIDMVRFVAERHVHRLTEAHKHYGDSWCKRGGVGAFMMLARKVDRIENRVQQSIGGAEGIKVHPYDIFAHITADTRPEGLADDIADLIDYLMLVEAKMRHDGAWPGETPQHRPDLPSPFGHQED